MRRDDNGYIVVETIASFLLFTFLMVSILSLINLTAVQARIHNALTQSAETISMYSYVLELTGAAPHLKNLSGKADHVDAEANAFKGSLNDVLDGLNSIRTGGATKANVDQVYHGGMELYDRTSGWINDTISDPKSTIQYLLSYGAQTGIDFAFEAVVRQYVSHFLSNGSMSGDEFLQAFDVVGGTNGLDFYSFNLFSLSQSGVNNSRMLTADGDVKLVVQYDLDYSFGALPLPKEVRTLHITQEAKTKAWLGGYGEGYSGAD